jgi:hypothetical protein
MKKLKACCSCRIPQETLAFTKEKRRHDGLSPTCRACRKIQDARYYASHIKEIKARTSQWDKANRNKRNAASRLRYAENPGMVKVRIRKWEKMHPEKVKVLRARGQKNLRDKVLPCYARKLLCDRTPLKAHQIPDALVNLKIRLIKLKRLCKNQKT